MFQQMFISYFPFPIFLKTFVFQVIIQFLGLICPSIFLYIMSEEKYESLFQNYQVKQVLDMNSHVVKLINEKTLPLNKIRYQHMKKIHGAIRKNGSVDNLLSSTAFLTINVSPVKKDNIANPTLHKSKTVYPIIAANMLINHLKKLKDLKQGSKIFQSENGRAAKCWERLRNNIIDTSYGHSKQSSFQSSSLQIQERQKSYRSGRKKQNFNELTERTETYLRIKKHELRQKYCKQHDWTLSKQENQPKKKQFQKYLKKISNGSKSDKTGALVTSQLQQQLLEDIRQHMLQEKMNRLKKEINHKKIVRMR